MEKILIEIEGVEAKDMERFYIEAGRVGMSAGKLLGSFVNDLICGEYSNGSDERDLARQWFERCGFFHFAFAEMDFLRFLLNEHCNYTIDEAVEAWKSRKESREAVMETQESLNRGYKTGRDGKLYTWKDITDGDGKPYYASREEWEKEEMDYIAQEMENAEEAEGQIREIWEEYQNYFSDRGGEDMETQFEKVAAWHEKCRRACGLS